MLSLRDANRVAVVATGGVIPVGPIIGSQSVVIADLAPSRFYLLY